jgi:signal transduction histidine kinase/PAS domain-containing protein
MTTDNGEDEPLRAAALRNASSILIARQRAERRSEAYLAEAQRLSHTGSFCWMPSTGELICSDETLRIFQYDRTTTPTVELVLERVHPEDAALVKRTIEHAGRDGKDFDYEHRLLMPDGSVRYVHVVGHAARDESGTVEFLGAVMDVTPAKKAEERIREHERGLLRDIEARKRTEGLLAGENRLLEMIASGDARTQILNAICRLFEDVASDSLSSILLLDPNASCLRHGASPSLPLQYTEAIDGAVIGPSVGSCGTAAYRRQTIIVSDIATDPLWADYRDLALAHGLRACWSSPILSSDGSVLGTFATYYRQPRSPTPHEQNLVAQVTHLASIALEREQAEQALEDLAGKLIHAQEEERKRIGRELHDHISQTLGLLLIKIDQLLAKGETTADVAAALEDLRRETSGIADDVHRLSHRLHSTMLDYLGLVPALRKLVSEFSERHDISITFAHASLPVRLPSDVALCLFRVAEESLTNIAKHSQARSASLHITGTADGIHLRIADAGTGFDLSALASKAGLGVVSMQERLRVLHGTIHIDSAPSLGTRIDAWVPSEVPHQHSGDRWTGRRGAWNLDVGTSRR